MDESDKEIFTRDVYLKTHQCKEASPNLCVITEHDSNSNLLDENQENDRSLMPDLFVSVTLPGSVLTACTVLICFHTTARFCSPVGTADSTERTLPQMNQEMEKELHDASRTPLDFLKPSTMLWLTPTMISNSSLVSMPSTLTRESNISPVWTSPSGEQTHSLLHQQHQLSQPQVQHQQQEWPHQQEVLLQPPPFQELVWHHQQCSTLQPSLLAAVRTQVQRHQQISTHACYVQKQHLQPWLLFNDWCVGIYYLPQVPRTRGED